MSPSSSSDVAFPLHVDRSGATARVRSPVARAEQLIEELLFTSPGERLNRPDLGCGLLELLFEQATDELRAATRFQVTSELQRWLGDVVGVVSVDVAVDASQVAVTVVYRLLPGGEPRRAVFVR
ncbi:MAG TPA: GPW/gp25 family protein [Solirubrobacteraceae bacterium]|nr:GPW/gp25 family protein [Solirubrobacteraceae bacterium]